MVMSASVRGVPETQFFDGQPKRLLIGGEWVPARSGRTFKSINPSTGEVIGEVAEADATDVDAAVAAGAPARAPRRDRPVAARPPGPPQPTPPSPPAALNINSSRPRWRWLCF